MKRQKRAFTLLEIMIVIFLIGLIGSVIGYNMKGSLDEGKAFKTRQAKQQIEDILDLKVAEGYDADDMIKDPDKYLVDGGIKKPQTLLRDGWNQPFELTHTNRGIRATSNGLKNYTAKKKKRNLKKTDEYVESDGDDSDEE